ncbi:2-hydroxyacyl-CoA dehydratase [Luteibacter anthropi]|uniref:2-hydroxyacyl-CoA dehydratase n=1 Tax=Luteibacter anthropi TaxID=564369 RepID=A0A7X5U8F0_9GAMM|nr:2-hydroxyacyl-CoA dehydratase [Luteibacter anthropi]NII05712.1 2-hydroxyacyl-CoA dehydratase [Luteibacter anthropi]URX61931.1 2-hydroxyacyl-CoA dehydratase [Luteibacter anthropi]
MNSSGKYDFRQFQEELAALDRKISDRKPEPKPVPEAKPKPEPKPRGRPKKVDPLAGAREEFEALRVRYSLSVADVVAWFPEEEGIAYLQGLLATDMKPRRRRKSKDDPPEAE